MSRVVDVVQSIAAGTFGRFPLCSTGFGCCHSDVCCGFAASVRGFEDESLLDHKFDLAATRNLVPMLSQPPVSTASANVTGSDDDEEFETPVRYASIARLRSDDPSRLDKVVPLNSNASLVSPVYQSALVSLPVQLARQLAVNLYPCVPKFWTRRTKVCSFCDRSVREKAWRSRKRVAQAT